MIYTEKRKYEGMGGYLLRKWYDDEIEPEDWHRDDMGYEAFARFGKRVIVDIEGMAVEYIRYDTIEEAWAKMNRLHTDRRPTNFDGIVAEETDGYWVTLEGDYRSGKKFDTYDEAVRGLAQMMVDAGCFPDAFYCGRHGSYRRIDDEVRAHHDAGGDKMLPRWKNEVG